MDSHSFPTEIADDLGLHEALLLQHFFYWHKRNMGNNKNKIDGHYWTYNSIEGFSAIFTYISTYKIRNTLKKLEKDGYILTANHNKKKYDRTTWYALTDRAISLFDASICRNQQMHLSKPTDAFIETNKPIPDSNTDSNTDNTISFDKFWNLYDKKINRVKCKKKWNSLKEINKEEAMKHLPMYASSTPDKRFRKNPLTYLNNSGWEDEVLKTTEQLIDEEIATKNESSQNVLVCPNHAFHYEKVKKGTIKFCLLCRTKMETQSEIDYMKTIGMIN